ncbi:uncharacterized protein [Rutidosis leptorrhynchoides]|uniref:uncharacterized protein n=1 Tax=Rutidosis leptorrhynchoides TaxID=125765 RepID=UPI003A999A4B
MKKGGGSTSTSPSLARHSAVISQTAKDADGVSITKETARPTTATNVDPNSATANKNTENLSFKPDTIVTGADGSASLQEPEPITPPSVACNHPNEDPVVENSKDLSAVPILLPFDSADVATNNSDETRRAEGADCTKS